jgi:hypothetical protein
MTEPTMTGIIIGMAIMFMLVLFGMWAWMYACYRDMEHNEREHENMVSRQLHDHYADVARIHQAYETALRERGQKIDELAKRQGLVFVKKGPEPEKYALVADPGDLKQ